MEAQTHQFNKGINLDVNPALVDSQTLTDALNGTLITFNSNDMSYQNDMGNARVHNARLKPGFIPLGVKEHGGVIYVASHNPLTGDSELGSFPSPERNHNYDSKNKTIEQKINWEGWLTGEGCCGKTKNVLDKKQGQVMPLLGDNGKEIYLNPGDLFKIALNGLPNKLDIEYFFNKENKEEYYSLKELGAKKKFNLDILVRNRQGKVENITESILDEYGSLNNSFVNSVKNENDEGDTVVPEEEALDNYRKAVKTDNFHIYSGKSAGNLNVSLNINTLEGFNVDYFYIVTKDKLIILFKIFINKEYNEDYFKKIGKSLSKNHLYLKNIETEFKFGDETISSKMLKQNDFIEKLKKDIYPEKYHKLLTKYNTNDFYGGFILEFDLKTFEDKSNKILNFNIVPESSIALECFNSKSGEIDLSSITKENTEIILDRWNYESNSENNRPLVLSFGYKLPKNEFSLLDIEKCEITFFDLKQNKALEYSLIVKNNGNNFSQRDIQLKYKSLGNSGKLDYKSTDENNIENIKNTYKDNVQLIIKDNTGQFITKSVTNKIIENNSQSSLLKEIDNKALFKNTEPIHESDVEWLISNTVYLCCIKLLTSDNEIITKDYRFIHTNNSLAEVNDKDFEKYKIEYIEDIIVEDLNYDFNVYNVSFVEKDDKTPAFNFYAGKYISLNGNIYLKGEYVFNIISNIFDWEYNPITEYYINDKKIINHELFQFVSGKKITEKNKKTFNFYNFVPNVILKNLPYENNQVEKVLKPIKYSNLIKFGDNAGYFLHGDFYTYNGDNNKNELSQMANVAYESKSEFLKFDNSVISAKIGTWDRKGQIGNQGASANASIGLLNYIYNILPSGLNKKYQKNLYYYNFIARSNGWNDYYSVYSGLIHSKNNEWTSEIFGGNLVEFKSVTKDEGEKSIKITKDFSEYSPLVLNNRELIGFNGHYSIQAPNNFENKIFMSKTEINITKVPVIKSQYIDEYILIYIDINKEKIKLGDIFLSDYIKVFNKDMNIDTSNITNKTNKYKKKIQLNSFDNFDLKQYYSVFKYSENNSDIIDVILKPVNNICFYNKKMIYTKEEAEKFINNNYTDFSINYLSSTDPTNKSTEKLLENKLENSSIYKWTIGLLTKEDDQICFDTELLNRICYKLPAVHFLSLFPNNEDKTLSYSIQFFPLPLFDNAKLMSDKLE